jgi:hypothetical protein
LSSTQLVRLAGQRSGAPNKSFIVWATRSSGDQLLDVEIDRRRFDPLAVLGRRGDARGKLGLRLEAAGRAAIDRGLVLGDLDQPLGQIEHLPLLHPRLHRSGEGGAAATTGARRMPLDPIGGFDLFERVALVPGLPAALLARAPPKAAGNARLLLQPVARRRLGAVSCPGPIAAEARRLLPEALRSPPRASFSAQRLVLARNPSFARRSLTTSPRRIRQSEQEATARSLLGPVPNSKPGFKGGFLWFIPGIRGRQRGLESLSCR